MGQQGLKNNGFAEVITANPRTPPAVEPGTFRPSNLRPRRAYHAGAAGSINPMTCCRQAPPVRPYYTRNTKAPSTLPFRVAVGAWRGHLGRSRARGWSPQRDHRKEKKVGAVSRSRPPYHNPARTAKFSMANALIFAIEYGLVALIVIYAVVHIVQGAVIG